MASAKIEAASMENCMTNTTTNPTTLEAADGSSSAARMEAHHYAEISEGDVPAPESEPDPPQSQSPADVSGGNGGEEGFRGGGGDGDGDTHMHDNDHDEQNPSESNHSNDNDNYSNCMDGQGRHDETYADIRVSSPMTSHRHNREEDHPHLSDHGSMDEQHHKQEQQQNVDMEVDTDDIHPHEHGHDGGTDDLSFDSDSDTVVNSNLGGGHYHHNRHHEHHHEHQNHHHQNNNYNQHHHEHQHEHLHRNGGMNVNFNINMGNEHVPQEVRNHAAASAGLRDTSQRQQQQHHGFSASTFGGYSNSNNNTNSGGSGSASGTGLPATASSSTSQSHTPTSTSNSHHTNANVGMQQSFSLPPELKNILYEVARYGKCSSLPWTASGISSFNAKRSKQYSSSRRGGAKKRHRRKGSINGTASASVLSGNVNVNLNMNMNMNGNMNMNNMNMNGNNVTVTTEKMGGSGSGSGTQQTFKSELSGQTDDTSSSSKSNTFKVSTGSTTPSKTMQQQQVEKRVAIETEPSSLKESPLPSPSPSTPIGSGGGSTAPSHADSNSFVDTGSLASHGSKRSVDLSVSTKSAQQQGLKRWRFYKDQSYASSCSESVSSAGGGSTLSVPSSTGSLGPLCLSLPFRTLRGALRLAVALVLEYSYKHRGGYKLSPAEKRRFEVLQQTSPTRSGGVEKSASSFHPNQTDVAFMERRMRLLKMLGGGKSGRSSAGRVASSDGGFTSDTSFDGAARRKSSDDYPQNSRYGPPFTIQRVAEILLMPERYYLQTHKLCNALEKLLLVTSPSSAFGGMTGGDTSQNRREEREMAALALKRGRDETQQRQRSQDKLKQSPTSDGNDPIIQMNVSVETPENKRIQNAGQQVFPMSNDGIAVTNANNTSPTSNTDHRRLAPNTLLGDGRMLGEMDTLQSVDNTYQHAHAMGVQVQNQGFGGRSDSFPPGHLGVAKSVTDDTLRAHNVNVNASSSGNPVLQHATGLNRPPSPSLFNPSQGLNQLMNNHQSSDLQGHHSGVLDTASCLRTGQNVQMEIVIDPVSGNAVQTVQSGVTATDVAYLVDQVEQGRSSASNSDIDSESDDISFDDSASDRSDGSDFDAGGSGLSDTAARVMALNRMQQQHRREQYLQDRALRQVQPFQPPPDSEYQSGDSVDSTMAEDSCGSDSSSSDFTD